MTYDPAANPRHLSPVETPDEQEIAELQSEEISLQKELDDISAKKSMFASKGWELVKKDLMNESARVMALMTSQKAAAWTSEEKAHVAGQVQGFNFLINLSDSKFINANQLIARDRLRDVRETLQETTD